MPIFEWMSKAFLANLTRKQVENEKSAENKHESNFSCSASAKLIKPKVFQLILQV